MTPPRWLALEDDAGRSTLRLAGAWRLPQLAEIEAALSQLALPGDGALQIDGSALESIDSASALVLWRALGPAASAASPASPAAVPASLP